MERIEILNTENIELDNCSLPVFVDKNHKIITLVQIWLIHLTTTSSIYNWRVSAQSAKRGAIKNINSDVTNYLEPTDISENTVKNYLCHFLHFLRHVENELNDSLHNLERLSETDINRYINSTLPDRKLSTSSVKAHKSSIIAFLNFLTYMDIRPPCNIRVNRKTIKRINGDYLKNNIIHYISKSERFELINLCSNKRDKLLLKCGYLLGLRTSENKGLMLHNNPGFKKKEQSISDLFREYENNKNKKLFKYRLNGKYTKRGVSRILYIPRDLLGEMFEYTENERKSYTRNIKIDELFFRYDNGNIGKPISPEQASNTFNKILKKSSFREIAYSYHDLRHTFATELYHSEICDEKGNETRSESDALLCVQNRLGHQSIESTYRYIRMRLEMFESEGMAA